MATHNSSVTIDHGRFQDIYRRPGSGRSLSFFAISSVFWKSGFYTFYTSLLKMMGNPRL